MFDEKLNILEEMIGIDPECFDSDNGRSLLFPNADDDEYEEILMDMCFKED